MSAEHIEPATVSAAAAPIVRRKRGRTLALLALLVVAVGGGYYWYRSSHQVSGDKPLVSTAVIGDVENAVASSGTLQPSNTVPVGAKVSGQLQKLHVQIGDQVEVDHLLGEIDARVQRNKVDSSRALCRSSSLTEASALFSNTP